MFIRSNKSALILIIKGKFTRLQFDKYGALAGSRCVTYLLEKVSFTCKINGFVCVSLNVVHLFMI